MVLWLFFSCWVALSSLDMWTFAFSYLPCVSVYPVLFWRETEWIWWSRKIGGNSEENWRVNYVQSILPVKSNYFKFWKELFSHDISWSLTSILQLPPHVSLHLDLSSFRAWLCCSAVGCYRTFTSCYCDKTAWQKQRKVVKSFSAHSSRLWCRTTETQDGSNLQLQVISTVQGRGQWMNAWLVTFPCSYTAQDALPREWHCPCSRYIFPL